MMGGMSSKIVDRRGLSGVINFNKLIGMLRPEVTHADGTPEPVRRASNGPEQRKYEPA